MQCDAQAHADISDNKNQLSILSYRQAKNDENSVECGVSPSAHNVTIQH